MNPTTPTNPGSAASRSAMSHGSTFMRPGAVAWGHPGRADGPRAGGDPQAPAAPAWLSVPGQGEGLVISVTLDDPGSEAARNDVIGAIEYAVGAVPEQGFPIDVTFPGEGTGDEPDEVDEWISANAEPFYIQP